ncbi:hypothetical protein ACHHYP_09403, partial [Achlya hypogyna]
MDNALQTIPKGLPENLRGLGMQNNFLSDLNYLPPHLKMLHTFYNLRQLTENFRNIRNNSIASIANHNWTSCAFLYENHHGGCGGCKLTNFTIDRTTFDALDRLEPFDVNSTSPNKYGFHMDTNVAVDAAACASVYGKLQPLWKGKTSLSIIVCVTPGTGLIVGCVVGGVAVLGIIIVFAIRRYKHSSNYNTFYYDNPTDGQAGTGGFQTQQSIGEYSDAGLNVEDLRIHKLDFNDLIVSAKKPLASGAFGEVWLGTYGDEK